MSSLMMQVCHELKIHNRDYLLANKYDSEQYSRVPEQPVSDPVRLNTGELLVAVHKLNHKHNPCKV